MLLSPYRILLFLSQLSYVWHLFSKDAALVTAAANVASHFILNNLFVLAWVLLWVRNHFVGSEVILAAHFINQHICYRHNRTLPAFVHLPAVAGPYAWALTALFWNGAIAVSSNSLAARIVANVFIWVIFVIGVKHIVHDKDYMFGYCLSFLTFCKPPLAFFSVLFEKENSYSDREFHSSRSRAVVRQGDLLTVDLRLCHLRCLYFPVAVHRKHQVLPARLAVPPHCRPGVHGSRETASSGRTAVDEASLKTSAIGDSQPEMAKVNLKERCLYEKETSV